MPLNRENPAIAATVEYTGDTEEPMVGSNSGLPEATFSYATINIFKLTHDSLFVNTDGIPNLWLMVLIGSILDNCEQYKLP